MPHRPRISGTLNSQSCPFKSFFFSFISLPAKKFLTFEKKHSARKLSVLYVSLTKEIFCFRFSFPGGCYLHKDVARLWNEDKRDKEMFGSIIQPISPQYFFFPPNAMDIIDSSNSFLHVSLPLECKYFGADFRATQKTGIRIRGQSP